MTFHLQPIVWYNPDLYTYEPYSNRKNKPWFLRYRGASFSSNACFLWLAIVWHSMAALAGPNLPTSFASDQLERSHGNVVFFPAMKGVIQEIYSEIMKPSGPLTSKQPTTSCSTARRVENFSLGNFIPHSRTEYTFFSQLPLGHTDVYLWPVTVLGCRIRILAF